MPEGDTIHYAANRIRPIVVGEVPELETPHPHFGRDRWAQRLAGRTVAGVDAHGEVTDDEALALVRAARPRMAESARDGNQTRHKRIYGKAGRPCPRCGARVCQRGQWDDNRPTYWCSGCQR